MTNGQLTKQLLKAAKTEAGEQLAQTACSIMRRFPLSSYKLLYDSDEKKVTPEAWSMLLQAAVQTDEEKLKDCNAMYAEAGCELATTFGRYTQPK